ncbi:hypothetical protein ACX27_27100 [Nostoc piscinale CENA21]|uniref:Uncharacterized protein n=1 Tax=Nostoc piscinale CENA21 TaxID=224013 RepID=A0A0M5MNC0_9NOSO|nr:hypothetical protein [Nostoc piscinale]ALF55688.1 hypothetical protein ACX27_27100 [Nostoc piscinale CENA21]
MAENTSPARKFRKSILSEFQKYVSNTNAEFDTEFYTYLECEYDKVKIKLSKLFNEGTSELLLKAEKNGLFLISVELFTFGRLDVAEDILDNIPGKRVTASHLAGILNRLLPLPPGFSPFENPNAIKQWLEEKRSMLKWDESLERYILEDGQY